MKRGSFGRQVIVLFLAVVAGYAVVYYFIQSKRAVDGPWVVKFTNESGTPTLVVNQSTLGIRDVRIGFPGGTISSNVNQTIEYGVAHGVPFAVPFGQCIFFDARFLPGTVVFFVFGHEVQLLPRVLTIDGVERPWRSGDAMEFQPRAVTNSPALPKSAY